MTSGRRVIVLALLCATLGVYEQEQDPARDVLASHQPGSTSDRSASDGPPPEWAVASATDTYRTDRVMVRGSDLQRVATAHATELARPAGLSGFGALAVPPGVSASDFAASLGADPAVEAVQREATFRGASASDFQWHHGSNELALDQVAADDFSGWSVAVLDSGVAYADCVHDGVTYAAAPSLAGSTFLDGWDFIDGDDHPHDEHMHGTHIASLIASDGEVVGSAPGADLLVLRVLDADNSGTEADLVDALIYAADAGVDVINMSLAFSPGYVASPALLEALDVAWDAGVVMIAAAGNDAASRVAWPAASPYVVAVSGGRLKNDHDMFSAEYTNRAGEVRVIGAGGHLGLDENDDGYPDGVLAETISPGDPSTVGAWFIAGSSQAAAVVSGAALRALQAGATPTQVPWVLQREAKREGVDGGNTAEGGGAGRMRFERGLEKFVDGDDKFDHADSFAVATMAWLERKGDCKVKPRLEVLLLDGDLQPVGDGLKVWARLDGAQSDIDKCAPDNETGRCSIEFDDLETCDEQELEQPLAWSFEITGVDYSGMASSAVSAWTLTDATEAFLASADELGLLDERGLAVSWDEGYDAGVDKDVAESWTLLNHGSGWALGDLNIVVNAPFVQQHATVQEVEVDLGGTGWALGDLNVIQVPILDFGGTGWALGDLNLNPPPFVGLGGTGWALGDLNFHPHQLLGGEGPDLGLDADGVLLGGDDPPEELEGTAASALLDDGTLSVSGYGAATVLAGSNALGTFDGGDTSPAEGAGVATAIAFTD